MSSHRYPETPRISVIHSVVVPIEPAPSYFADATSSRLKALQSAAADADERAWNAIVACFDGAVRAVARRYRLSTADVEDVVQTTWLRLFEHIGDIREPHALRAWLQTTAARESVKVVRAAAREQPAEAHVFESQPTFTDPGRRLAEKQRSVALGDAIDKLPDRHRRLMRMLATEPECSYEHVSRVLDMPIGSIGPIRARCLQRMRRDAALQQLAAA